MNKNKSKQMQSAEFCGGNFALIPLLLVFFLIPLIMRAYIFDSGLSQFDWFPNKNEEVDIFLYWKGIYLIIIAACMTVYLVVRLAKNFAEIKKDYWIYFLFGYGLLTLLSTLLSPYRSFGFSGIYEQFESVWVILSYCVVTLYAYYVVRNAEDLRVIRKALFYLLLVICFIGVSQLIGMDFWESDLGRRIMVSEKYAGLRENLTFNFSGSGIHQVYLTLYNPNYVGAFASLILPITVILIFASKTLINRISWGIISLVLLVCTFGSGSKTFILALGGVAVVAIIFYRKTLLKHWKMTIAAIAIVAVCGTAYFSYMNVNLFTYVKNALIVPEQSYAFENFEMTDNSAILTYGGAKLNIQYIPLENGVYFIFQDESGNELEYTYLSDGQVQIVDERFESLRFIVYAGTEEYPYFPAVVVNGNAFLFTQTENGYSYVNTCGKLDEIKTAEAVLFTKHESFASGRGYIWSRTIPLLKNTIFLGSGADTFTIVFPQDDYVGKANSYYHSQLITKPHNLYLQIGVQHGVLALVCFLTVCLIYFVQSCKLYWKVDSTNSRHIFGLGIMLGIVGYLISGMANDSCVALAPLFWAFLGIGFAVNKMNKEERV